MSKSVRIIIAVLAVVVLALPLMAKPITKSLTLTEPTKIAGTLLKPGDYKLVIDGDKLTVEQGKHVVATATVTWEHMNAKSDTNCITITADGELQKICFTGDDKALILGQ